MDSGHLPAERMEICRALRESRVHRELPLWCHPAVNTRWSQGQLYATPSTESPFAAVTNIVFPPSPNVLLRRSALVAVGPIGLERTSPTALQEATSLAFLVVFTFSAPGASAIFTHPAVPSAVASAIEAITVSRVVIMRILWDGTRPFFRRARFLQTYHNGRR